MHILWWQMCVRGVIIFFLGIVLLRLAGRRAFGRQSAIDIVLTVLIGSNLSRAMTGGAPFLPDIAGSAALILLYYLAIHLTQRFDAAGWLLKGPPVPLLRDGMVNQRAMRRQGVSHLDLEEAARTGGCGTMGEVEHATLERNGHISIVRRKA